MATIIVDEHRKNSSGGYDDVRRITNADLVNMSDGENVEDKISSLSSDKQDAITGQAGQIVGFNAQGKPVAQEAPDVDGGINTHNNSVDAHANMGWITSDDSLPDEPALVDADTLGGVPANQFAKTADLDKKLSLSGGTLSGDLNFALIDEVNAVTVDLGWRKDSMSMFQYPILRGIQTFSAPDAAVNKQYVDGLVGNINSLLDELNGEVV